MQHQQNDRENDHTPKIVHFIWIGGPIPEKYLATICKVCHKAHERGYQVNLWLEKDSHYHKTAEKMDISEIKGLTLKNIQDDLLDPLAAEGNESPLNSKLLESAILRERAGEYKNLAAASDILRYMILYQFGGWYFDTDTLFENLTPPIPPDYESFSSTSTDTYNR